MNTDAKPWCGPRKFHARVKRRAVCQQRGAGYDPVPMSIVYASVYTLGPSQVIRVHDQIFHLADLTTRTTCPQGQLTFRTSRRLCTIDRFPPQL
jgi:hypothetical protein